MRFSLRTGCLDHSNHDYIRRLIDSIRASGSCFDEVWLATSYGIPSREQYLEDAAHMAWAADRFREAGISASMQVSRTVGHSPLAVKTYGQDGVTPEFGRITGLNGSTQPGKFCWNSLAFREYVDSELRAYAAFRPEIVWVDDDVRLRLLGPSKALCFCDDCLRLFNERTGGSHTRETLRTAIYETPALRREYIDFQTETLADFTALIARAVHETSPDTIMALQNGGSTTLATDAQRACLNKMYEVTGRAPAFRAGGGFYDDHNPAIMLQKALTLNYLNSRLPDYVLQRSSEIENLPFTAYGKSTECTLTEAALYLAYGCNEASVTLMLDVDPLSWHERMFRKITAYRPFLDAYEAHNRQTVSGGLCIYQPPRSILKSSSESDPVFWNDTCIWEGADKLRWGIPFHSGTTGNAYFLSEKAVDFLDDRDMQFLAANTVLTDSKTLRKLMDRGFGSCILADVQPLPEQYACAVRETAADHPVNAGNAFTKARIPGGGGAYCLTGDQIEPLSRLTPTVNQTDLGVGSALVPTALGAKWMVTAIPLSYTQISYSVRELIRRGIDAAARQPLPAYVASPEQILIVPRLNKAGQTASVFVMNVSTTDAEEAEIAIANPAGTECLRYITPENEPAVLPLHQRDERFFVRLPALRPWRPAALLL